jgi:hypothetical protein
MLRWMRRRLRLIRYYSASRHETVWTRLADASLIASLVLAWPAAWYCDRAFHATESAYALVGLVERIGEGEYIAHLLERRDELAEHAVSMEDLWGRFHVIVNREKRGMPLVTTEVTHPPSVTLEPAGGAGQPQTRADLPDDSPLVEAVLSALRRSESAEAAAVLDLWSLQQSHGSPVYRGWFGNVALWWIALFVGFGVALLVVRVVALFTLQNRAARRAAYRAEGRCATCGYDIRGIEFSERCPECGSVLE